MGLEPNGENESAEDDESGENVSHDEFSFLFYVATGPAELAPSTLA